MNNPSSLGLTTSVASRATIIGYLQSRWGSLSLANEIGIILAFNALVIISAQIAIPLPFSPVPITGQTFAVLLTAMALGRVRGSSVIALYLLEKWYFDRLNFCANVSRPSWP